MSPRKLKLTRVSQSQRSLRTVSRGPSRGAVRTKPVGRSRVTRGGMAGRSTDVSLHEFSDATRGKRLQGVMAEAGVASRRQCEAMICAGRVTVNGQPVTALPAWVDDQIDRIEVDGSPMRPVQKVRSDGISNDWVYVLLNKPRNVVTTTHDPQNRTCVTDLVDLNRPVRLFPVGRLDADTTGLVLLTNDGQLTQRLTHPRYGVAKRYVVSIRGRLGPQDIDRLRQGLHLTDRKHAPGTPGFPGTHGTSESRSASNRRSVVGVSKQVRAVGHGSAKTAVPTRRATMAAVEMIGYQRDRNGVERTKIKVTLHEGQNRQIRRLLARLGFKVRRLQRVAIGSLTIKGLRAGQWRLLTGPQVRRLRVDAGLARR